MAIESMRVLLFADPMNRKLLDRHMAAMGVTSEMVLDVVCTGLVGVLCNHA